VFAYRRKTWGLSGFVFLPQNGSQHSCYVVYVVSAHINICPKYVADLFQRKYALRNKEFVIPRFKTATYGIIIIIIILFTFNLVPRTFPLSLGKDPGNKVEHLILTKKKFKRTLRKSIFVMAIN